MVLAARKAKNWRGLTAGEVSEAQSIFLNHIDYTKPKIYKGRYFALQPDTTAMAPDGNVYFPPAIYNSDFSRASTDMWLFIHELAHVWQVQQGVWLKFRRVVWERVVYDYGTLNPYVHLNSYTVEQQAAIIADWYRLRYNIGLMHGSGYLADFELIIRRAMPQK